MKNNTQHIGLLRWIGLIASMMGGTISFSQTSSFKVTSNSTALSFPVVADHSISSFYYDKSDATVVKIAAEAFRNDLEAIADKKISLVNDKNNATGYTVVAGTIGHSAWLDELIQAKAIDVSSIKNRWEAFTIKIVDKNNKKLLVIAGSDRRGTAFGIFHLSRTMGVSPFVWWADAAPAKRKEVFVSGSYTSAPPSVKYRGLFINDEDWGLQPWAAKHMDTIIKDIGPNTYAKVFELMLRLKANYIWPAMHPCTKAFYYYKENPRVADDYAIIVGGSHCEPMLRNNVFEWAENFEHEYGKKPGEWRYDLNKEEMYKYWDDRVKQAVNYESVYTVGMRGIHDGSMPGPKDPVEKLRLLESVITDQRKILNNNFGKPASETPQIFVPYKEVLSLYRRGLQLANDVTIIWPDDNHGYIRQLPNEKERKRSGGHGVYYHLSYWGAPQDYLWLSSISPSLISYEMTKAYEYGANRLWVFNVGDIKPAELELQFAMDMAWDIGKWTPGEAHKYTRTWAKEIFGEELADEIAVVKNQYYHLAAAGKPEHIAFVDFEFWAAEKRIQEYTLLSKNAQSLRSRIPASLKDAYYQLVEYPVLAARLMNIKTLYARGSMFDRGRSARFTPWNKTTLAREAFDSIRFITTIYNKEMSSGKWDGIMSWHPRDLPVFKMPITSDSVTDTQKDSLQKVYFTLTEPVMTIFPSNQFFKKSKSSVEIKTIPGLGISGRVLTTSNKTNTLNKNSDYIDFEFELEPREYFIEVKCLPLFDVDASKNIRYGIAVNNETPQAVNVHAEADSREWRVNVLRGYSLGKTSHKISQSRNKLRVWFKDPNLVISSIEIYKY
jgi:hypothetical protein